MAEYGCPITLVTPGPDIAFNSTSGNGWWLDPNECRGLDAPGLRLTVDPAPQTAGAVVHPGLDDAMHIVLVGLLIPGTDTVAGRNSALDDLEDALAAIVAADGTLQQTPTGGALRSLTVRLEIPLATVGGFRKRFSFGLIAADPTWT